MKLDELMTTARDAITVGRVFGEPYEKDGITIIPAASIGGGGGGGAGQDQQGHEGEGGGFGVGGRPAGVFVIRGGDVHWRPAIDVNRLSIVLGAVAIAYLLTGARVVKARAA